MRYLVLLVAGVLLSGCATTSPVVDYDSSQDFQKYRTFAFISDNPLLIDDGASGVSPLLQGRLMNTATTILQAEGYVQAASREDADFMIGFTIGARDKMSVSSYPEFYRPYYSHWGWGGPYYGHNDVEVTQYTQGILAVDLYDVSTRKPVWHGVATKKITGSMRRNPDEAVREILGAILADFPPNNG